MFGLVRTHSDLFGCIRIHLDAYGCFQMRLADFRKIQTFAKFWMHLIDFWRKKMSTFGAIERGVPLN